MFAALIHFGKSPSISVAQGNAETAERFRTILGHRYDRGQICPWPNARMFPLAGRQKSAIC
jgi:hypothetical protein